MAGSGEWRSSPSAFCSHPALMPTPLSQLFQKNSEYLFSSSISNKKSSPIWRALSKSNIIDVARLKYLFFFCFEENYGRVLFGVVFGRLYIGHHLNFDPQKPAIIRQKSRSRAIQGITLKQPVSNDMEKAVPYGQLKGLQCYLLSAALMGGFLCRKQPISYKTSQYQVGKQSRLLK